MTGEGFWQRAEIRRLLPVAVGVVSFALLLLTLTLAPRRAHRPEAILDAPEKPEPASVTPEKAELRTAPDPRSPVSIVLTRGAEVTIIERKGLWCGVRDRAEREGYLLRAALENDADRTVRSKRAETILKFAPLSGDVAQKTPFLLAPASYAPVWGEADQGTTLQIYAVDHAYFAIRLPDGTLGFVASKDVDIVPANPSEPALIAPAGKVVKGISVSEADTAAPSLPGEAPPETPAAPPRAPAAAPGSPAAIPAAGISGENFTVAPAVLVEKVEPAYPPAALAARLSGTVILQISIDRAGAVTKVEVKREGPLGMTLAAKEAVSRWRYRPAVGPSGPIPSMKEVRIEFQPPG